MATAFNHNIEYTITVAKTSLFDKLKWTYRIWLGIEVDIRISMKVKDNE